MASVSKNAREGARKKTVYRCAVGHELVPVKTHGSGMSWQCSCTGYVSIRTQDPYLSIKPDGVPGKKRDAVRGGEARPCR